MLLNKDQKYFFLVGWIRSSSICCCEVWPEKSAQSACVCADQACKSVGIAKIHKHIRTIPLYSSERHCFKRDKHSYVFSADPDEALLHFYLPKTP